MVETTGVFQFSPPMEKLRYRFRIGAEVATDSKGLCEVHPGKAGESQLRKVIQTRPPGESSSAISFWPSVTRLSAFAFR
jgi:hypothetical protein